MQRAPLECKGSHSRPQRCATTHNVGDDLAAGRTLLLWPVIHTTSLLRRGSAHQRPVQLPVQCKFVHCAFCHDLHNPGRMMLISESLKKSIILIIHYWAFGEFGEFAHLRREEEAIRLALVSYSQQAARRRAAETAQRALGVFMSANF